MMASSRPHRARRLLLWLPVAFLVLLGVQAVMTSRREYFETPDYKVEATVRSAGTPAGGRPLEMVMLGDSTVAGLGSETVEDSLVLQTAQRVADQTGRAVHARGLGISGARAADVRDEQVPRIEGPVDVVVIVIGSNDVTHLTPPWRFGDLTRTMIREAQRQAPGASIVLGGIPLFGEATALDEPLRSVVDAYAAVLRRVQQRAARNVDGATYVDIATEASPRFVGVPDAMSRDGFHPARVGYGFWADALAPAVVKAVGAT